MPPPRSLTDCSLALHTDEYALTMAQSFLHHGQTGAVSFEMTVRTLPPVRGYLVAAGLEQVLAYLRSLRYSAAQLEFLSGQGIYSGEFLDHLAGLRFSGDVDAMAEGTPFGAGEPLLRITAPRIEATLVESTLLALVNHQSTIASKASRIVTAARGRLVWDFSLRRLHGPEAGVGVARAAYLAGCAGTATVAAGERFGIPTTGTMAHHFVLAFGEDGEQAAFEQFLRDYPGRAVLLVDTYDTVRGVRRAIAAARATGVPLAGVRLDSGDIAELARQARVLLDEAGMCGALIIASGDLDEYRIDALLSGDDPAPLDAFGVGTMLGTSPDAPSIGGIYKLVEQSLGGEMTPTMKLSAAKQTDPGAHQVFRFADRDVVALRDEQLDGEPLLGQAMRGGEVVAELPSLQEIRLRCQALVAALPDDVRRIAEPRHWTVERSPQLLALRERMGQVAGGAGGTRGLRRGGG
ncbi:MAG TPA: nicotinate phosphoribosyltransferase [Candidatus Dormibacteraeota bacterium]|jgi:nicotinate phosphoribosyltransferase|nr:nicotinate phosphoribosyltransferase [Candidatus Dormibacteraeota bacterium]